MKFIIVGAARPNFMKIAPLIREILKHPKINYKLVHTGQHYDFGMSDVFFRDLEIPSPDIFMGIAPASREEFIENTSKQFLNILDQEKPDLVIVVGDVNSTIACAKAAKAKNIKVAHVEAGLRSFDLTMPEEINRIETDKISDYLYITEQSGIDNLKEEKITGKAILVGNVMIDTLKFFQDQINACKKTADLNLIKNSFYIATFHRPSNVDSKESIEQLLTNIKLICNYNKLVLPLHPRTKKSLEKYDLMTKLESIEDLVIIEPLGYIEFLNLVANAKCVITDSGGIQEETTYLNIPCLTMRENTERPITVNIGSNTLIGSDTAKLEMHLKQVENASYKKGKSPELWDGDTAQKIIQHLISEFC